MDSFDVVFEPFVLVVGLHEVAEDLPARFLGILLVLKLEEYGEAEVGDYGFVLDHVLDVVDFQSFYLVTVEAGFRVFQLKTEFSIRTLYGQVTIVIWL